MKRIILIIFLLIFLTGCSPSNSKDTIKIVVFGGGVTTGAGATGSWGTPTTLYIEY